MVIKKYEEDFPRGNTRGRSSYKIPALREEKVQLFEQHEWEQKEKGKKKKTTKNAAGHVIPFLYYKTLEVGMVLLGRVREVHPYHMYVSLPSRLVAKVLGTAISAPYANALAKLMDLEITQQECPPLTELYREGQPVICSIVEVSVSGELTDVLASLDPELVNSALIHTSVKAGQVINAAVANCEDYGYTLHTGVAGLSAFLPAKQAANYVEYHNSGRPLVVGEVLRCLVTKCRTSLLASRALVTIDPDSVADTAVDSSGALQPAMTVHCVVEEVLKNGLVVSVGRGTGYVEQSQLADCWSLPTDYNVKDELRATVLYTPAESFHIADKAVILTLKDLDENVTPTFGIGDTKKAVVAYTDSAGVYVRLGDDTGCKGFVSIRRLGEEDVSREDLAIIYPAGKEVYTRILAFDYMEQIYICSLEQEMVGESSVAVGERVSCQVAAVTEEGLKLSLGSLSPYVTKAHSADLPHSNLFHHFAVGDVVDGRVLSVNPRGRQVTMTLKETLIITPALSSYKAAQVGDCYWATVLHVEAASLYVSFYGNVRGRVQDVAAHDYFPGKLVKCYITYVNERERKLLLSLTPLKHKKTRLVIGDQYELVVRQVFPKHLAVVACDYIDVGGIVPKNHLRDPNAFVRGDFLKGWMLKRNGGKYIFSPNLAIRDFFKGGDNVKPDSSLTCFVARVTHKTFAVYTPLPEFPYVETPLTSWKSSEKPELYEIVKMYVRHINTARRTLCLSCTAPSSEPKDFNGPIKSHPSDKMEVVVKKHDVRSNKTYKNTQKKTELKTNKQEKCKRKQDSKSDEELGDSAVKLNKTNQTKEPKKKLKKSKKKVSDVLPVLHNQPAEKEICEDPLPRKKKKSERLTTKEDENQAPSSSNKDPATSVKSKKKKNPDQNLGKSLRKNLPEEESKNEVRNLKVVTKQKSVKRKLSEIDKDIGETSEKIKKSKQNRNYVESERDVKNKKRLTLSESGFMWDVRPEDLNKPVEASVQDDEEKDEETSKGKKKKTAGERRNAAKEEEARIRQVEQSLLDSESNPQSVDQFDRAVLARPDDSDLWIKYMSHHLQATEIEKARAVARRALQTINQRHEIERLNVQIALLNLENLFGSQETLKICLDEALRTNDEFTVYCKMLNIYAQASKAQEAEQLVHTMVRKFSSSEACWVQACSALMKCGVPDKARTLLRRAISALPTKQHVNLLCKFAVLENQYGFSEQAQTLFEHILTSYPKRTDVWNVYVDMLVKSNQVSVARQILERATRQKLPARKMKMLFSKWVSFEEKHGGAEKVEHVRKQALAYVSNVTMKLE